MKAVRVSISLAAFIAATAPALADVTAAELWQDWQEQAAASGTELTAQATETGDGLILTDLTLVTAATDGDVHQSVSQMTLRNNGDGTVGIDMGTGPDFTMEFFENGTSMGTIVFGSEFDGMAITASGDIDNLRYDYSANAIAMALAAINITAPGEDIPQVDMTMSASGLAGHYAFTGSDGDRRLDSASTWQALNLALDVVGPASDPGRANIAFDMGAGMSDGAGSMTAYQEMMRALSTATPGQPLALPANLDFTGGAEYASLSFSFQFDAPGESFLIQGSNGGGAAQFDFNSSGMAYDISAVNTSTAIQGAEIPIPISFSAESTRFAFSTPLSASPDPQAMAAALDYTGLTLNDQIWAMADPVGALPRDPITIRLDLTGTVQMFVDLMTADPTTLNGPPGELRSLQINDLLVNAVGAELTGNGSLQFQPGAMPPIPIGSVNLALSGLNGLLDRLTGAGMLPPEQAGMARGMAGMFARPGAGPDQIETTIDFLPGGGITANGIPLQ